MPATPPHRCLVPRSLSRIRALQYYCVEAAVHQRIVRSRSRTLRRNRDPPVRGRR